MRDLLAAALSDRYAVERELGRGGMASVWLARDRHLDRPVAIKVLHPELAAAIGVDRFVREIQLTTQLQHPNIVPVLDAGSFAGAGGGMLPWYAMAYVEGETLRARLDRERQLPVEDALRIAEDTAAALAAAHRAGIVHRDIKPENLLLSGGHVAVADFGIAKALVETGGEKLTSTGIAIGTPAYMSPEQASADGVDARSDQYSLATVLYEMLAGEPPYTGPTAQAVIARRMTDPPRAIRPVRPGVPASLEAAVLRGLARVPADRYRDIGAFAAALRSPAELHQAGDPPRPRRRRLMLPAAAIGILALLAASGWLYARRPKRVPMDPEVAALIERGTRADARRTPAGAAEAFAAFNEAIRRDSASALAWAGLSRTVTRAYTRQFIIPGISRDSVLRIGIAAADRATALDPGSAEAWRAQATVRRSLDPTDFRLALAAARRAIALDSSYAPAWHALAVSLTDSGDLTRGLEAWHRATAVDPSYGEALAFLSLGYYWRRNYDSAAFWADSAVAADPSYILGRTTAGQVAIERGERARARAAFDAAQRISSGIEIVNSMLGAALAEARGGNRGEAEQLLLAADSLMVEFQPPAAHTAVYLAHLLGALGRTDEAIAAVAGYQPRGDLHFQMHLRCDPPFAPIASDPRFRALLVTPRTEAGC